MTVKLFGGNEEVSGTSLQIKGLMEWPDGPYLILTNGPLKDVFMRMEGITDKDGNPVYLKIYND